MIVVQNTFDTQLNKVIFFKGTQTSHYDRKALEGNSQRQSVVPQPQHRRRSLAETIMAGVTPSVVEEETKTAMMFIKDEVSKESGGTL